MKHMLPQTKSMCLPGRAVESSGFIILNCGDDAGTDGKKCELTVEKKGSE